MDDVSFGLISKGSMGQRLLEQGQVPKLHAKARGKCQKLLPTGF